MNKTQEKELRLFLKNDLKINRCYINLILLSAKRIEKETDDVKLRMLRGKHIRLYLRAMERSR